MMPNLPQTLLSLAFLLVSFFTNAQIRPTSAAERLKGLEKKKELLRKSPLDTMFFRNIGPSVMSGRVTDIDANPSNPTEFYVAYASGGVWYTNNNGISFRPIFDSADVLTIGDIAVNWTHGIIWVGTGEVNSSRSSYAGIGMFKSADRGQSWEYVGLPESHHIGKIQLHPTDPNTVWVAAMGHLYSSNPERGVYKTTDGGRTWKQTLFVDNNTGAIDLDVNPLQPNELYAAMWYRTRSAWNFEESGPGSGIYKSTDGGETWTKINRDGSGLPDGAHVGRIGLAVYPKDPRIIYTIIDNQQPKPGTDRRDTSSYQLDELKNLSKEEFANLDQQKLDTFLKRNRLLSRYNASILKEMVASNKIKPTALYDYFNINTGFEGTPIGAEVYRSNDGGKTWVKTHKKEIPIFFTYGYYFAKIYVSPVNPDKVIALGYTCQLSTDGGKTWENIDKDNVHADHHALWIDPNNDSHFIDGNDGGVNITYDNGEYWFKANMPPVAQYYAVTVDNAKPYNVYGGMQDNGVWYLPSSQRNRLSNSGLGLIDDQTKNLGGGDGMQVQVDPRDNVTVYYGSQFGSYVRTNRITREGTKRITPRHEIGEKPLRFNWQTPILMSPHNPDIIYFGSHKLYRSFNKGDTMIALSGDLTNGPREGDVPYGTITTISESPLRFGLIYTGTDDGNIHVSKDAGASWTLISAPSKKKFSLPQGLWVSRVIASGYQEPRVYVSLNGYRFDDFMPYLYVSEDYGNTWKAIGKDLPAEPINVVREDPKNENIIYVGTDGGLYVSFNRGESFVAWSAGLPRSVPVHDIAIQERENEIVLGTHGRSIYIAKLDGVQKIAK